MSVIGYGYTNRDRTEHVDLCPGCLKKAIITDWADVIPAEAMTPLGLHELLDLLDQVDPSACDRIGEINPWNVDDPDNQGLACRGCGVWLAAPQPDPAERIDLADWVWQQALAEPPPRRLRRGRPLAEHGIELVPGAYGRVGELAVFKDGFAIGYLFWHGGRWDAHAAFPPGSPREIAAVRERHRDDALDALILAVKHHARLAALAIRDYREQDMDLYADLLARRLAAHRPTRNPHPQEIP